APARRYKTTPWGWGRACMKNLQVVVCRNLIQALDLEAAFVAAGIPGACQNHASRGLITPFHLKAAQITFDRGLKNIEQIRLESNKNRLRFRVAKTNIVFEHFGPCRSQHQSNKKNSAKWKTFFRSPLKRWLDNFTQNAIERSFVENGTICYCAHTAGVRPGVVFPNAFVIAGRRHQCIVTSVREQQD